MTETESVSDVVFHQPQIITEESILTSASAGGAAGSCGARTQSGAMELGRRLLLAARAGDTALVLDLMAKGAPFTNDWLGTSALHLAASNAHTETCGVLLRAGVSRESRTKVDRTPLHLAAYAGHADVAELLLQHGAQVDCRDMLRMTPLHWAAERGHTACCAALLRHGAEIKPVNKFRKTPQQLAAAQGHRDVLALIDEELKLREAAKSVRAIVPDRTAEETADTEVQHPVFTAVQRTIQEVKLKPKSVQEKSAKPDSKTEKAECSSERADGPSGAAALLRRHGITLLPADDSSTVLSAIQSGRTVVLSDAGKLMLKESEEPTPPPASTAAATGTASGAAAAKPSRGMLLTATPVRSTPHGVKVFTVNNRLSVTPAEVKPRAKIMTPQDLQQVKIVQLPPDARIVSPRKAKKLRVSGAPPRTPVKIIMNKSNFQRLVAGPEATPVSTQDSPEEILTTSGTALEPAVEVTLLRSLLAQAHKTIATLNDELDAARAKLAQYEQAE